MFGVLQAQHWPLVFDAGIVLGSVPLLICVGFVHCHCTGKPAVFDNIYGKDSTTMALTSIKQKCFQSPSQLIAMNYIHLNSLYVDDGQTAIIITGRPANCIMGIFLATLRFGLNCINNIGAFPQPMLNTCFGTCSALSIQVYKFISSLGIVEYATQYTLHNMR